MDTRELKAWFENVYTVLENAYISHVEPWRQSGMSGPEERWNSLRKPVADCITHSGSFLDIGCANGYLLECIIKWTQERGITIDPYGLDISARLVTMAQQRLTVFAEQIYVGNSFYWVPPMKFDYVRTELCYVPSEYELDYVQRLLDLYLKDDGRLLLANYAEGLEDPSQGVFPGSHPTKWIADRMEELGIKPERYVDGFDPIKNRRIRIAVVPKSLM